MSNFGSLLRSTVEPGLCLVFQDSRGVLPVPKGIRREGDRERHKETEKERERERDVTACTYIYIYITVGYP